MPNNAGIPCSISDATTMTHYFRLEAVIVEHFRLEKYFRLELRPVEPVFREYERFEVNSAGELEEVVGMEVESCDIEFDEVVGVEVVILPSTKSLRKLLGWSSRRTFLMITMNNWRTLIYLRL